MPGLELAQWIEALPSSTYLRESVWGYTIIETSHVVSMCLFLAFLVMMDLRMAGLAFRNTPFSVMQTRFFPGQMVGTVIAFLTGGLLFYMDPVRFWENTMFWIKIVLLVVSGANAFAFHITTYKGVAAWDNDPVPPPAARFAGFSSLTLWSLIVISGRLIAYDWL